MSNSLVLRFSWLQKKAAPLAIVTLTMIVVGFNVAWITQDQSPPLWDMAGHSARALIMEDYLTGGHLKSIITHDTIYPPFVTVLTAKFFWLFGHHEDMPQFSLLFFVLIASAATFGIAKKLFQSSWLAVGAVLIVSCLPLAAHFSRIYDMDYPLMALTAGSLFCYLQTNNFRHRGWSVVFGMVAAAGMLTKWTLFIFVLGPVLLNWLDRKEWRPRLKNFGLACGLVAIIIGPWYALHSEAILRTAAATRNNVFSVPTEQIFSFESLGYYWHRTVGGMSWPLAVLSVAGLVLCLWRRQREHWLILAWTLLPYLIMTLGFYSKESRYLLPIFPALAIAGAYALWSIPPAWIRRGAWLLLGVWCVSIWFESSWGGLLSDNAKQALGVEKTYGFTGVNGYGYTWPTNYGGAIRNVAPAITSDLRQRGVAPEFINVAVVPNSVYLNDDSMRYYGLLADVPIRTGLSNRLRGKEWPTAILEADYLVTKTGDQGPKVFQGRVEEIAVEEKNPASPIFAQFTLLGKWSVTNPEFGYPEIRLYRKK